MVMLGGVQQGFGRNAAYIKTGSAKGGIAFYNGGFKAQLCTTYGGDISSGTGADDGYVVFHFVFFGEW